MIRINGKLVEASIELVFSPTGVVLISVMDRSNGTAIDFAFHAASDHERAQIAQAALFYRTMAHEIGDSPTS